MFVYFLISILVNYRIVEAAPLLIHRADIPQDSRSLLPRTLFGIIWSCLSTTIICAWTSVHPNVPPPNQWKARWNRLWLMSWMMIAPELVLAWAVRQYFAAREIRDEYNRRHPDFPTRRKWTLKHGHLLQMGGFHLIDPDQKYTNEQNGIVLTVDYFKENPNIDIPDIGAAEIEDRSKGDALTKILAILQTTWFIIQCIARGQQGLALTELELVTLALASLNAVTFGIWWHKPLGVQEPVKVFWKAEAVKVEVAVREEDNHVSFDDVIGKGWEAVNEAAAAIFELLQNPCGNGLFGFFAFLFIGLPIMLIYIITLPFFLLFPLGTVFLLRIIKTEPVPEDTSRTRGLLANQIVAFLQTFRYQLTSRVSKFVGDKLQKTFWGGSDWEFSDIFTVFLFNWYIVLPLLFLLFSILVIFLIPFFTFIFLVSFIFTAVFGIVTTDSIHPGASHVPSFYAPTTTSDRWSRMVVFALFGVIFGGLHCIGWNFKFATDSEQTLWRATSLAITVIPLIVAPIDYFLALRLRIRDINSCGKFERGGLLILDLVVTILLFIYVLARLSLIALALALLRSPPPDALTAVNWTKYIPHLFSS